MLTNRRLREIEEEESEVNESLFFSMFSYYRNKRGLKVLNHSCFNFRRYYTEVFESFQQERFTIRNELACLIADCQAGKTHTTIPAIFLALALEFNPILVCCNTNLKEQFTTRIYKEAEKLFGELNIPITPKITKMFFEPLFLEPNAETIFTQELIECLFINRKSPRIIIVLKHHKHIETINRVIGDNINRFAPPRIWSFFDEYQLTGVIKEHENEDEIKIKYDAQIRDLRRYTTREIGITATAEDVYLTKTLPIKNICFLEPSSFYRGSGWVATLTDKTDIDKFNELMDNKKREGGNFKLNNIEDIQKIITDFKESKPVELERIIKEVIIPQSPFDRTNTRNLDILCEKDQHPVITLVMLERQKKEHQLQVEKFLINNPVIEGFGLIIFNGDKITLVEQNMNEDVEVKKENGHVVKLSKRNGIYGKFNKQSPFQDNRIITFMKNIISIQDAIEWFGNFGKVNFRSPIKHIAIIAYDMANCGTSMVSHYFGSLNYHLTHMILLTHHLDATASNQRCGRLNGNHGDDIGLTLITTSEIHEMLMKTRCRNEEIRHEILDMQEDFNLRDQIIGNALVEKEIFKNRLHPKYHKVKANNKKYKQLIENPNADEENHLISSTSMIDESARIYGNDMSHIQQQYHQLKNLKDALKNVSGEKYFTTTSALEDVVRKEKEEAAARLRPRRTSRDAVNEEMVLEEEIDDSHDYLDDDGRIDGVDVTKIPSYLLETNNAMHAKIFRYLLKQTAPVTIGNVKKGINYKDNLEQFKPNLLNGRSKQAKYGKLWSLKSNYLEINSNISEYLKKKDLV